jgi:hypothetical protein
MARYIKIGGDIVNLESIARVTLMENQSGISDRIIIEVGGAPMVVDSAIVGREEMQKIRERFEAALAPEDWNLPAPSAAAPVAMPLTNQPLFARKSA